MATYDTNDTIRTKTATLFGNPFAALASAFHGVVEHRRERREIVRLSRLPEHVIRDMGFDPDKIAAELKGSWDDVDLRR
jgi:uncharacterized protein YjiS (DUF1127 family)